MAHWLESERDGGAVHKSVPVIPILRRFLRFLPPLCLLSALIGLWQIVAAGRGVPDYLVPRPSSIWEALGREHGLLLQNAVPTAEIALTGLLIAVIFGVVIAVAIRYSRIVELSLYPILISSQSVPLIALAPVLVVVFGYSILPKLLLVSIVCFFPVVVNTVDGFRSVDRDVLNLLRSMGAGPLHRFRMVEFPAALPYIFSGAKLAATYSVVGALVGEWVGSSEGLGYLMIQKESSFDTSVVFAAMLVLTALGVALFLLVSLAERLALPWRHAEKIVIR